MNVGIGTVAAKFPFREYLFRILAIVSLWFVPPPRWEECILESLGFVEVRQKGSHKQFCPEDGRATTVPFPKHGLKKREVRE